MSVTTEVPSKAPSPHIERVWAPLDAEGLLDENGYLHEEGFWLPRNTLVTLDAVGDDPCVILLGETGLGKTHALETYEASLLSQRKRVVSRKFVGLLDSAFDRLYKNSEVQAWMRGGETLHLLLDGLDESPLTTEGAVDRLVELLRSGGDLSRMRLRITTRTFVWSPDLRQRLTKIFGQPKELQLMPLRRSQVRAWIGPRLEDADGVMRDLEARRLGPLASRPLTLGLLIDALKDDQRAISDGRLWDLYDRALLRRLYEQRRLQQPQKVHRVADILGAATVFAGYESFSEMPGLRLAASRDRPASLDEFLDDSMQPAEQDEQQALLRDALKCGEFVGSASERRWQHPTFAEFRAARWLKTCAPTLSAKVRWLTGSDGALDALPVRVEATAAWLASCDDELFEHLLQAAPAVLLRCDRAALDEGRRLRLVRALLANVERGWWDASLLRDLGAPGEVDRVLEEHMQTDKPAVVRELALWVAWQSRNSSTATRALDIARDPKETDKMRRLGVRVVSAHGTADQRRALVEVVQSTKRESRWNVLEAAVRELWRDHETYGRAIGVGEILHLVDDLSSSPAADMIEMFVRFSFWESLRDDELSTVFDWCTDKIGTLDETKVVSWGHGFEELIRRAWRSIASLPSKDAFARFLNAYGHRWHQIPVREVVPLAERLTVAIEQVRLSSENPYVVADLIGGLTHDAPVEWLISRAEQATSETAAVVWAEVLGLRFRQLWGNANPADTTPLREPIQALELIDNARKRSSAIDRVADELFVWDLDKPWVQEIRRREIRRAQRESKDKKLTERLAQQVTEHFEALRSTSGERFCRFTISLRAYVQNGNIFVRRVLITEAEWWREASEEDRRIVRAAAERYITEGDPHTEDWYSDSRFDARAEAGYLALRLLMETDPVLLSQFSTEVWARWMPVLLSQLPDGHPPASVHLALVERAASSAPDAFVTWVDREVEKDLRLHGAVFIFQNISDVHNASLAERLIARFDAPIPARGVRPLLDEVARSRRDDAVSIAWRLLSDRTSKDALECAIEAGAFLMHFAPRDTWPALWPLIQEDEHLRRAFLEGWARPAAEGLPLSELHPSDLVDLWECLVRIWPFSARERGAGTTEGPFEISPGEELRNVILNLLTSNRNPDALNALRCIVERSPELPGLTSVVARAETSAKMRSWQYWSLGSLVRAKEPIRIEDRKVRDLVAVLASLREDSRVIRRICHDAGMSTTTLRFDGASTTIWNEVVEHAINQDQLDALVAVVYRECPTPELRAAARRLGFIA